MRCNRIALAALVVVLSACGGGSGDDGGGDDLLPPAFDATGVWIAKITGTFSSPTGHEDQDTAAQVTVTQTGNDVTVDVPGDEPVQYTGTVSGADYSVSATLPEDDGSTAETIAFTLATADAGNGMLTWVFTGTGGPINGGGTLTVARQVAPSFDMSGTWDVTQSGNFSNPPGNEQPNGTVASTVTQTGNTFTMTLDGAVRNGFVSGAQYYVEYDLDIGGGNEATIFVQFVLGSANAGNGTLVWRTDHEPAITGGADVALARQ